MPNSMISTDPIVARSFFLDFPKLAGFVLSSVSGIEIELDVVTLAQNGPNGRQQRVKTIGGQLNASDVTVQRMAPQNAQSDKLWTWFLGIRDNGMKSRTDQRQDGSIIFFDASAKEVGRFNIFNAWPTKISTDGVSTESNDALTETITFACERITRTK